MTRTVRAEFDERTVTVYQAYRPEIADAALRAGTFVAPFKHDRMTWIKPSLLWMMYRCGFGTKPDQERVLAVRLRREGFEWALAHSCASSFDPRRYRDHEHWRAHLAESPVRVQWDPERDTAMRPAERRAVQVGLGGDAVRRYVDEWIVSVHDRTELAGELHRHHRDGDHEAMRRLLPVEREYPLPERIRTVIGGD
ncbi:hypothetical protein J2S53_002030 [Actinopolyspora lacussalsi]|nr:hypothetical protein [Actinopolyspora lacussalsi]